MKKSFIPRGQNVNLSANVTGVQTFICTLVFIIEEESGECIIKGLLLEDQRTKGQVL